MVEVRVRALDGTVRDVEGRGTTIVYDGEPAMLGSMRDVTDRKRMEAALRASEERYHTLFDYAPDGILIADTASNYLDANASICRMLGYTRDELIGLHAVDIVAPAEVPNIEPALSQINSQPNYQREWRLKRKDGSIFAAEVIVTTMPGGNLLAMVRDITERLRVEETLRDVSRDLRVAEESAHLKSAFLATMSHELRTPLNSIIGFTGVLLQRLAGPLTPDQAAQLGMVQGSGRHLLALINDILDLSKIEAGQFDIVAERFGLRASLEQVMASLQPLADKKNLALRLRVSPGIGEMVSDRLRVEQIVINLVGNAIKFTERGTVTLEADVVEPGASVRLRVTDTGVGIKPADVAKLFQPFRQVDSSLTRQNEGTGLGLAICHRLAGLLGGEISVASEWSKGSEFTVTLPSARSASSPR
jgi:PAS domain S-box-containing protein